MKQRNICMFFIVVLIFTISMNVYAESCEGVIGGELLKVMNQNLYKPIKYITPILLLVLTSIDFAKVVFSGTKEGMDKAKKNFMKRAIAALIIFFAPDIINMIVEVISQKDISACIGRF